MGSNMKPLSEVYKDVYFNKIKNLQFSIYTDEEIEKMAVLEISSERSMTLLGHYCANGIYDARLGPTNFEDEFCESCKGNAMRCGGHCGYINLPLPVINPFLTSVLQFLLDGICFVCYRFQISGERALQFIFEMKMFNEGFVTSALDVMQRGGRAASNFGLTGNLQNKKNSSEIYIGQIQNELVEHYREVKKDQVQQGDPTSNSQSIYFHLMRDFFSHKQKMGKKCVFCKASNPRIRIKYSTITIVNPMSEEKQESEKVYMNDFKSDSINRAQNYITTEQARNALRKCYKLDGPILETIFPLLKSFKSKTVISPTDILFISNLIVIPPRFRPLIKRDDAIVQNALSTTYEKILGLCKCLRYLVNYINKSLDDIPKEIKDIVDAFHGATVAEKTHSISQQLQIAVTNIYDADVVGINKVSDKGIRQIVEKKFGLMRQNLMGKRVNFSARSVAAPDPMLAIDEVGVPMDFATRLFYKVPVTSYNIVKLRQLVINGAYKYPGAVKIENEEGRITQLLALDETQRIALANALLTPVESCVRRIHSAKIVYRHLENGDFVLMNRQPTLHKPSIQAHRARIMANERVLRMPYASCKAYNADFDGDELNLHFPQDELSRSEAKYIVTTKNQYLTPKDGTPLAGLIQDSVVANVMITIRGTLFDKEDYQQLVFMALSNFPGRIKLMKATILKPKILWTGKQIISTIMLNLLETKRRMLTFSFKTAVKVDLWKTQEQREWLGGGEPENRKESMTESEFIMRNGELLSGVVDKYAIGSTSHGLVHTCYDLYGPTLATHLLTAISRLSVAYLQWFGHTISVKEFLTPPLVSAIRRNKLEKLICKTPDDVALRLNVEPELLSEHIENINMSRNVVEMAVIDSAYTAVLGPLTSEITSENENGLFRRNLDNNMRMMVNTGAKGSKVNMSQMASLFGSVSMDGKRMPLSATGKSLPSAKPYDVNPMHGGYIHSRFMTGIDPRSYFFLCVVGRDSLQHTAVKTAHSGYVQRCLMKHLEGIHVEYDRTVRNSDGTVLQFEYGEDGLDVNKIPFLLDVSTFDTLIENKECFSCVNTLTEEINISEFKKKVRKYLKYNRKRPAERKSAFLKFSRVRFNNSILVSGVERSKVWSALSSTEKAQYEMKSSKLSNVMPVSSLYNGCAMLGVVSEKLEFLINDYYKNYYSKRPTFEKILNKAEISNIIYKKAMSSRVDPGEAVGALCAQALGEPLTQMTLNTFHFAGRDELNITLGVPRMVEILKTASPNISTPIMEIPFLDGIKKLQVEKLRKKLIPVPMSKVINTVEIKTYLSRNKASCRIAELLFKFLPHKEYMHLYSISPAAILDFCEKFFIKKILILGIKNSLKVMGTFCSSSTRDHEREIEQEKEFECLKLDFEEDDASDDKPREFGRDLDDLSSKLKKSETDEGEEIDEQKYGEDLYEIKVEAMDSIINNDDDDENNNEENLNIPSIKNYDERVNSVLLQDRWITDYSFDSVKQSWCKISLALPIGNSKYDIAAILKLVVNRTNVHSIRGIKKAVVVNNGNSFLLRTEGVNVPKIYDYANILDLNRLYTNSISLTVEMFGIEAAQRSIIKEIRNVQAAYDIKVDFRHLSLLADYFTCEGVYKACSRHAIETCASPIQKMTYETGFSFLRQALIQGYADRMSSPSANVMVGQPIRFGTNAMDILTKVTLKNPK